jgi:hypothetical protein
MKFCATGSGQAVSRAGTALKKVRYCILFRSIIKMSEINKPGIILNLRAGSILHLGFRPQKCRYCSLKQKVTVRSGVTKVFRR